MSVLAMILFPVCVNLPGILTAILLSKKRKPNYDIQRRPPLSPPRWVIGPVWTILYILIGTSGYLIWSLEEGFSSKHAFAWSVYFIQLFLNYIWYPIYFGLDMMLLAFIDIVLLDIFIYLNIYAFSILYPLAGYLLIPYAIWVTFASYLNFANWWMNRNVPEEVDGSYMKQISKMK